MTEVISGRRVVTLPVRQILQNRREQSLGEGKGYHGRKQCCRNNWEKGSLDRNLQSRTVLIKNIPIEGLAFLFELHCRSKWK